MGLENLIGKLEKHTLIHLRTVNLYVAEVRQEAIKNRFSIDLLIKKNDGEVLGKFKALLFTGRPPIISGWIELYNIRLDNELYSLEADEEIIGFFSKNINSYESFFIDYLYDRITLFQLEKGVPPPASRLGYYLVKNGLLWIKDWYYPEGGLEGGPKLQAKKAVDKHHMESLKKKICKETILYLRKIENITDTPNIQIKNIIDYSTRLLSILDCKKIR